VGIYDPRLCINHWQDAIETIVWQELTEEHGEQCNWHDKNSDEKVCGGEGHEEIVRHGLQLSLKRHRHDDQHVARYGPADDGYDGQRLPGDVLRAFIANRVVLFRRKLGLRKHPWGT